MKISFDEVDARETLAPGKFRRCYNCFRPKADCFCGAIPAIDNQTEILILQHARERFHPFNTARIVRRALKNSSLIAGETRYLANEDFPIRADARLLYPSTSAPVISDLASDDRPSQLVIVDGTWHHAKTLVRDIPALHDLPRIRLDPESPGRYRIRREPNRKSLSTLEATVAALRALEPDTVGLDQLVKVFDRMVEQQLVHSVEKPRWRQKESTFNLSINIPRTLISEPEKVVVAYGESTEGRRGEKRPCQGPVYWVAQRLLTGENFACTIQPTNRPLTDSFLSHLELERDDFASAVSQDVFRTRWKKFLKAGETLAVYSHRTARLLEHVEANFSRSLILKSVDFRRDGRDQSRKHSPKPCSESGTSLREVNHLAERGATLKAKHGLQPVRRLFTQTLTELMLREGIVAQPARLPGRAGKRLANAVAWICHLKALGDEARGKGVDRTANNLSKV